MVEKGKCYSMCWSTLLNYVNELYVDSRKETIIVSEQIRCNLCEEVLSYENVWHLTRVAAEHLQRCEPDEFFVQLLLGNITISENNTQDILAKFR